MIIGFLLIWVTLITVPGQTGANSHRKFDEYPAIDCDHEWARLDNYNIELQKAKTAQAVVIVYGGRRGTKRDEVQARISFIKNYLTVRRSLERRRLTIYNGGFRESLTTELWIIPSGVDAKVLIKPTVNGKDVKFKGGKVGNRIHNCSFIG